MQCSTVGRSLDRKPGNDRLLESDRRISWCSLFQGRKHGQTGGVGAFAILGPEVSGGGLIQQLPLWMKSGEMHRHIPGRQRLMLADMAGFPVPALVETRDG